MFSNELLNRIILGQDQSPTPEFNRYCDISDHVANQEEKLATCHKTDIENGSHSLNQEANWKKINHALFVDNSAHQQHNHSDSLFDIDSNNYEKKYRKQQSQPYQPYNIEKSQLISQIKIEQQNEENQFIQLKNQMINIECLATKEISKLKAEILQKDEQIEKLINVIQIMRQQHQTSKLNQLTIPNSNQVGTNTENDYKNEEIKSLKQALVRHIRINKQLTKKLGYRQNPQNDKNAVNMSESIQKLVSKINI